MTKHTKGPWKIWNTGTPDNPSLAIVASNNHLIAQTIGENDEANARLIASAPELLEACKFAEYELSVKRGCMSKKEVEKATVLNEILMRLEQAIAKATGKEASNV